MEDALKNFSKEKLIHGYTCPETNRTTDAIIQTRIEKLPDILIIQLQMFNEDSQAKKSTENINFPISLKIPKECLVKRLPDYSTTFKLLAAVHHEAVQDHYFADIYDTGTASWLRCHGTHAERICVQELMKPHQMQPYLLFYAKLSSLIKDRYSAVV